MSPVQVLLATGWPHILGAIEADLRATASQHGAADPGAAAKVALGRHGGDLAKVLQHLRATAAAEASLHSGRET